MARTSTTAHKICGRHVLRKKSHIESLRKLFKQTTSNAGGAWNRFKDRFSSVALPSALGFSAIAAIELYHLNHPSDKDVERSIENLKARGINPTQEELNLATPRQKMAFDMIPYRLLSRLWGTVHNLTLPEFARKPLYLLWTTVFGANLDDMRDPLESYRNLAEFFVRPLKDGVRKIASEPRSVASPVDGQVIVHGVVDSAGPVPFLEQIKGIRYRLDELLGFLPAVTSTSKADKVPTRLHYMVIYLAPGDYHRIHNPVDWQIKERLHVPGKLYPVHPWALKLVPSLFAQNERVVLTGEWRHGFFCLTAVGALNVGSIKLDFERSLKTNASGQGKWLGKPMIRVYDEAPLGKRGQELARFQLGSTVILVFHAPESFKFIVNPGDKITLGRMIGRMDGPEVSESDTTFPVDIEKNMSDEEKTPHQPVLFHSVSTDTTEDDPENPSSPTPSVASSRQVLGPAYASRRQ